MINRRVGIAVVAVVLLPFTVAFARVGGGSTPLRICPNI
jgi:hypothetical protein